MKNVCSLHGKWLIFIGFHLHSLSQLEKGDNPVGKWATKMNRRTDFSPTLEKLRYNSKQPLDAIFTYWFGKMLKVFSYPAPFWCECFKFICTKCINQLIFKFSFCFDMSGNSRISFWICRLSGNIKDNLQNPYKYGILIYNINTGKYMHHKYIDWWLLTRWTHPCTSIQTKYRTLPTP